MGEDKTKKACGLNSTSRLSTSFVVFSDS